MRTTLLLLLVILCVKAFGQPADTISLWPDKTDNGIEPTVLPDQGDGVTRVTDVEAPRLFVFPATGELNDGAAAIVCPGGGFKHLSMNKEGTEVAVWLNGMGITAFVLQYSVPDKIDQAIRDLHRAMRVVRSKAETWRINPYNVGVIGFSAGGWLSASVSCVPDQTTYELVDAADTISSIPDFAMLIYPGHLGREEDDGLTPGLSFGKNTPPMFIFCAADDFIANFGSIYLTEELLRSKVPVELHILPEGMHGYGLRAGNVAGRTWPVLAEMWLRRFIIK